MQAEHDAGRGDSSLDAAEHPAGALIVIERETTSVSHAADPAHPVPIPDPVRWAIGVLAAVVVLAGTTSVTRSRIEDTLHDRTVDALAEAGLDPQAFVVDFDHRSGTITGALPEGWTRSRFSSEIRVDDVAELELVRPVED